MRDVSLKDIMPPNLLRDEKVKNLAELLSKELQEISAVAYKLNFSNPRDLPEEVIDHLLWENHIYLNEGLSLATTLEEKINLLENTVELHRTKGTPYAVEQVLKAVSLTGEVVEWKEYDQEPYHFIVELEFPKKRANLKDIRELVLEYKNNRSWFDDFVFIASKGVILLVDKAYLYPVIFKTCGEFGGEFLFFDTEYRFIDIADKTYSHPVEFDVNEIQSSIYGETTYAFDDAYHYDVGLLSTGEMETVSLTSDISSLYSKVADDAYNYGVEFEIINEILSSVHQNDIGANDETYQYKAFFPITGEMAPIKSVSDMSVADSSLQDESYSRSFSYPICGEFYAEE